jgi:protease secretion system membrane fusion protein
MTVKDNSQKKNQILEKLIANLNNSSEDPGRDEKYYARVGWIILILGFGSFMLWATFAPLDMPANHPCGSAQTATLAFTEET